MLRIFKTTHDEQLDELDTIVDGSWINLIAPSEAEIERVATTLNIPVDVFKDALDDEERSRIEREDNFVFIIVDMPVISYDEVGLAIYDTIPIGMIVTDHHFVTVYLEENPMIEQFMRNKVKKFFTFKKTRFALQILYMISTYYLRYLKQINKKTSDIERELHQSMKNKELFTLLSLEKSLVYFTTSLKSNNIVMEKMLKQNFLRMYEDDEDLLEDVIIENKQAIEMAEIYSSILSGMMDAFASVISNNVNIVMKFLTSITIVLAIPTMVASFFGMNVPHPFTNYHHGFILVIFISVVLSCITALIFWKRRYF